MSISEEAMQPKCPVCGAQPVHTDEHRKFMICKERVYWRLINQATQYKTRT